MRVTDKDRIAVEKIVWYSWFLSGGGNAMPLGATQESNEVSQEAEGKENYGKELLLRFLWEGSGWIGLGLAVWVISAGSAAFGTLPSCLGPGPRKIRSGV